MELITAEHASEEKLNDFLQHNQNLEREQLLAKGYVVEFAGKIEGCFVMDDVADRVYWLKQLFVTKQAASSLPVLLEAILALAREKQAQQVFVHSHQPMVDVLLESLQFHPQKDNEFVQSSPNNEGYWWMYHVS
ncbi:hypothetical protein GCM10028778_23180 [Barrientosiimonas marina]|uniref:GNAT family N-acetyltransferase n=1 Tax=Lentibacillus kimchii TaxID=1542911 RepID=A0ABW2UZR3_9BACI